MFGKKKKIERLEKEIDELRTVVRDFAVTVKSLYASADERISKIETAREPDKGVTTDQIIDEWLNGERKGEK
jgi:hypothetical protein